MVGVPRSTGCRLCVKRRVRCDEERPACHNCVRYGAECPGYTRTLKFVDGKHETKRDSAGNGRTVSPRRSVSPRKEIPVGARTTLLPLVEDLISKRNEIGVFHFLPWFHGLPNRVGAKVTLDSAVFAFTAHLRGKETGDDALLANARSSYVQSLSTLQAALDHPEEWRSSETLCSAMLLCLYESFAGTTSPESWMGHAHGVGRLMQARGAKAHDNEWDVSMVLAFRGLMIMHALFSLQDCFLAKPEWRNLWMKNRDPLSALIDEFWDCFALCPGVVSRAYRLHHKTESGEYIDPSEFVDLTDEAEDLRNRLIAWHGILAKYLPPPQEVVTVDLEALHPTILTYHSVWIGSLYMGYWASLLVLQSTLASCHYPVLFAQSSQELLNNILKSVEYTSQGLMGPYRIGYSLRIAAEFAGPRERAWIVRILGRTAGSFAATTPTEAPRRLSRLIVGASDQVASP